MFVMFFFFCMRSGKKKKRPPAVALLLLMKERGVYKQSLHTDGKAIIYKQPTALMQHSVSGEGGKEGG